MFVSANDRLQDDSSFSCPGKKRTKRIRHRGGADREAYQDYIYQLPFSPASSRPPLCTPSGAGRECLCRRIFAWPAPIASTALPAKRRGDTQGGRDWLVAPPWADFFGYFLVQRQESNILRSWRMVTYPQRVRKWARIGSPFLPTWSAARLKSRHWFWKWSAAEQWHRCAPGAAAY